MRMTAAREATAPPTTTIELAETARRTARGPDFSDRLPGAGSRVRSGASSSRRSTSGEDVSRAGTGAVVGRRDARASASETCAGARPNPDIARAGTSCGASGEAHGWGRVVRGCCARKIWTWVFPQKQSRAFPSDRGVIVGAVEHYRKIFKTVCPVGEVILSRSHEPSRVRGSVKSSLADARWPVRHGKYA